MTSSFIAQNLAKGGQYTFSLPGSSLGGIEDSYIKLQGECHPDFDTTPIGHPNGVKMCTRKLDHCGRRIGDTLHEKAKTTINSSQGYNRGSVNLYDVHATVPTQQQNPQYYSDRRIPHEADLLRDDYLRWEIRYNGTGIKTLRTPHELGDSKKPYLEYGYSFTPNEDPDTGNRTATSWSQTQPMNKYDINRLHQPYTIWKREHEYMGHPQDWRDTSVYSRIV